MRSSGGKHYVGLDHVRALAASLVFLWHFNTEWRTDRGMLSGTLDFLPNPLLAEGHTGVAMFMVLSGYLFTRLTDGKRVAFGPFFYNRFMRLAPLLIAVILLRNVIAATRGLAAFKTQFSDTITGIILPTWPNGGWSIATELHFYLLFPVLLWSIRRRPWLLVAYVAVAILIRIALYQANPIGMHYIAYFTIIGRFDQFALGMLFARYGHVLASRHVTAALTALVFLVGWYGFVKYGGFYRPDHNPWIWIYLTTFEALSYGILIAWYDRSFRFAATGFSGLLAKVGDWSYSIYLLHLFIVPSFARFVDSHIVKLDSLYMSLAFSVPCFIVILVISRFVYEHFERRFLKNRRKYLFEPETQWGAQPANL